jgi:hypothetical protein
VKGFRVLRLAAVQAIVLVAIALPAAAEGAGSTGRTHFLSSSVYSFWHHQIGCDVRDVQVYGFDSTIRSRLDESAQSDIGVYVNEYDACTGLTTASWQGAIAAPAEGVDIAADLAGARIQAEIPVTDWVSGARTIAAVDVTLAATGLASDQMGASHFRDGGGVVNWAGSFLAYEAAPSGSVRLGSVEVAFGTASGALSANDFGQTMILRQQLLARIAAGALGGNVVGLAYDSAFAEWRRLDGCRDVQTMVRADDLTDWSGTRTARASYFRFEQNWCTGAVDGAFASAPLDELDFSFQSTSRAALKGTLTGERFSGEPVSVDVDLGWTGKGVRSSWQLTTIQRHPSYRSTFHHSEAWRDAALTGTVDGAAVESPTAAGIRTEKNIVTNG